MKCPNLNPIYHIKNFLGGQEVGRIKLKLFNFTVDWFLEFGTAIYHAINGQWIESTLTYAIKWGSGVITTIGFLKYKDIRDFATTKSQELGCIYIALLYVPTFLPFVFAALLIHAYKTNANVEKSPSGSNHEMGNQISTENSGIDDFNKLKDLTMKVFWMETVLESKPQALVQSLFLIEKDNYGWSASSLWSMRSMTNDIYELISNDFLDTTETFSKLYGNSYTVISILAPVMVANTMRDNMEFDDDAKLLELLITTIVILFYYVVFEVIYQLTYFLSGEIVKARRTGDDTVWDYIIEEKNMIFGKIYQFVLVAFYLGCVMYWNYYCYASQWRKVILSGVFVFCLLISFCSFFKARDFVTRGFELKNVKTDRAWGKLFSKLRNRDKHEKEINI